MAGTVYQQYSVNDVFKPASVNVICNQLMQGLIAESFTDFNDHFALAGNAALHFENNTSGPIQNIHFKMDVREIYVFIAEKLKSICPTLLSMSLYEERLIARFSEVFIEFYLVETLTTTNHSGIYINTEA